MRLTLVSVALSVAAALQPAAVAPAGVAAPAPAAASGDHDLLLRAARGEPTERTPVWLMRQAGRYMAAFRKYSDKYAFRVRSETPEIAVELSLQCYRRYKPDGVIMFSDILTPLPAMGVDFDVIKGTGPRIDDPVRTPERCAEIAARVARGDFNPAENLAFTGETLRALSAEIGGHATLLGFVGSPWTLAAYAVEGGASRHAHTVKRLMMERPESAHALLGAIADAIGEYACYQVEQGAQVIQLFESWAHHLGPDDFDAFAAPYAARAARVLRERHPTVPIIYFANGGSSYLERQRDALLRPGEVDMLSLDWAVDMAQARATLGPDARVQGNVDPAVLLGPHAGIEAAVEQCIERAGGPGSHILNLGHGVVPQTPEDAVEVFIEKAKSMRREG